MQVVDRNREVRTTAVLAVVCLVLQLALAPNIGLGNGRANFGLVLVGSVALFSSSRHPVLAGFLSGLVFDLCTTGPIGLMAFCLTLVGFALGLGARERVVGDLATSVVYASAASLAVSVVYHVAMLLVGQSSSLIDALFLRALPTALLTIVAFLPFAYYFSRVRTHGMGLSGRHASGGLGRPRL